MTRLYPDLGSASDWLEFSFNQCNLKHYTTLSAACRRTRVFWMPPTFITWENCHLKHRKSPNVDDNDLHDGNWLIQHWWEGEPQIQTAEWRQERSVSKQCDRNYRCYNRKAVWTGKTSKHRFHETAHTFGAGRHLLFPDWFLVSFAVASCHATLLTLRI